MARRACCTASTSRWNRAASPRCWARTAPARPPRCGRSAAWCAPSGEIRLGGERIDGKATEDIVQRGVAHVPDGRGTFIELTVEENLRLGALHPPRPCRVSRRTSSACSATSPGCASASAAGRHAVGRRAADAGDRARAAAAAAAAAAGRAVIRPGAADRAGDLRDHAAHPRRTRACRILLVEQNASLALDIAEQAYLLETGRIVMSGHRRPRSAEDEVRSGRSYLGII